VWPVPLFIPIFCGIDEFWLLDIFSPGRRRILTCYWISGGHIPGLSPSITLLTPDWFVRDGSGVMLREPTAGVKVCAAITIFHVATPILVFVPEFVGAIAVGHTMVLVAALIDAPSVLIRDVAVIISLRGVFVDVLIDTSESLHWFLEELLKGGSFSVVGGGLCIGSHPFWW